MAEIFWDIETTSLLNKVDENRITCIGLYHSDLGIRVFSSKVEERILQDFFEFIGETILLDDTWVSFNGINFDVPYICRRAKALSIPLPSIFKEVIEEKGKSDFVLENHVDLMIVIYPHFAEIVRKTSTGRMTKDGARNFFNIYEPRAGSAQHCLLAAQGDDWSAIFMHNALDLFTTKGLYDECVKRGWC